MAPWKKKYQAHYLTWTKNEKRLGPGLSQHIRRRPEPVQQLCHKYPIVGLGGGPPVPVNQERVATSGVCGPLPLCGCPVLLPIACLHQCCSCKLLQRRMCDPVSVCKQDRNSPRSGALLLKVQHQHACCTPNKDVCGSSAAELLKTRSSVTPVTACHWLRQLWVGVCGGREGNAAVPCGCCSKYQGGLHTPGPPLPGSMRGASCGRCAYLAV
jgi:hypothetical protein